MPKLYHKNIVFVLFSAHFEPLGMRKRLPDRPTYCRITTRNDMDFILGICNRIYEKPEAGGKIESATYNAHLFTGSFRYNANSPVNDSLRGI